MDSITDSMDVGLSKLQELMTDGEAYIEARGLHKAWVLMGTGFLGKA